MSQQEVSLPEFQVRQNEIRRLEKLYDHQVLGNSGVMYADIPREVWDHVPSAYKRLMKREDEPTGG